MSVKYILRLDDISWDMNYENFARARDLFLRYGVRPIIGVIPDNQDPSLRAYAGGRPVAREAFWAEMRTLQREHGWAAALHGWNHVYGTRDGGMFHAGHRSEFAGLPYQRQAAMVREGKAVLEANGLRVDAFMAPGHSLDWTTVEALLDNGIQTVTDGRGVYPYRKRGMLFVPQMWWWPHPGLFGVCTVCYHVNGWNDAVFRRLEAFLQTSAARCRSFQETVRWAEEHENGLWPVVNLITGLEAAGEKAVRAKASGVKRRLSGRAGQ